MKTFSEQDFKQLIRNFEVLIAQIDVALDCDNMPDGFYESLDNLKAHLRRTRRLLLMREGKQKALRE